MRYQYLIYQELTNDREGDDDDFVIMFVYSPLNIYCGPSLEENEPNTNNTVVLATGAYFLIVIFDYNIFIPQRTQKIEIIYTRQI